MFPVQALASAQPWAQDDRGWVGVVRWVYPDGVERSETLGMAAADGSEPQRFATPEAALQAAETYGMRFRLSARTERLVGVYGGESGG